MASIASSKVTEVASDEQWEQLAVKVAHNKLVVAFFWAEFHEPSKRGGQMDTVFSALAGKNDNVVFLKVEAEVLPDLTAKYPVASVPTFIFMRSGKLLGKVEGANPPELMKRVNLLSTASAAPASNTPTVELTEEQKKEKLNKRIARLIASAPLMVFMKGTPDEPKCKFSRRAMEILKKENLAFGTFNILNDNDVRQGIKTYSNWPTFPQFYKNSELIGGLDIIKEMLEDDGNLDALRVKAEDLVGAKPESLNDKLARLIASSKCMLFMKGSPTEPQCGFSRKMIALLKENSIDHGHFDILTDNEVRQGLKTYSNWPTFPQLYVDSNLIGGLDIVTEMAEDGDLKGELGLE